MGLDMTAAFRPHGRRREVAVLIVRLACRISSQSDQPCLAYMKNNDGFAGSILSALTPEPDGVNAVENSALTPWKSGG